MSFHGTFTADTVHSSFMFAIPLSGLTRYKGSLSDVAATVEANGAGVTLEGSAAVESISIVAPPQMRAHVLGPEFLDAERHPAITFRSTAVRLDGDGGAEVDGELTIRGVTRPVTARGRYETPRAAAFGGELAAFALYTTIDRRDFGITWQMETPTGGDALGWDIELEIELQLLRT